MCQHKNTISYSTKGKWKSRSDQEINLKHCNISDKDDKQHSIWMDATKQTSNLKGRWKGMLSGLGQNDAESCIPMHIYIYIYIHIYMKIQAITNAKNIGTASEPKHC